MPRTRNSGKVIFKTCLTSRYFPNAAFFETITSSSSFNALLLIASNTTERVAILLNKLGVKGAEKFKPVFTPKEKQPKKEKSKK